MIRIALTFALATLVAGCVTPAKFKALESRVATLEAEHAQTRALSEQQNARLENLNSLLKSAKLELMKSSADTVANLDELTDITRRNQGAVEETRFLVEKHAKLLEQLSELAETKMGVTLSTTTVPVEENEGNIYDQAMIELAKESFREARALFQQYTNRFPEGDSAADAQFYVGETYRREGDHEAAIQAFKQVYENYRESERMPEALLGIGDCLAALGECDKAKKVYGLISRDAKDSPQEPVAKERLKELKENCKK